MLRLMHAPDAIQQILNAEHHDPFSILGYHENPEDGTALIQAFLPSAGAVQVKFQGARTSHPMTCIRDEGFFAVTFQKVQRKAYQFEITGHNGHNWTQQDPYRFTPHLSEYDLHLFGEGNHHRLYEILGSHPGEHQGVQGVKYAVWAPNARRVSVVGPFNDWDGRRNPMRCRGSSGIWELFIPGHAEWELYKYEIRTGSGHVIEKTDPYAYQYETRPKNAAVVVQLKNHAWQDQAWMQSRARRNSLDAPISIYEVHLGSWRRVPDENNRWLTYDELADQLIPYVQWMGFTHIELLPVAEHPFDGSWGYQVTGNFAPTSRFGDAHAFMRFVNRCHQAEIGVLIDWVPGHFPRNTDSLAQFDGTCLYEHEDPRLGAHQEWGTLIYNYGRNEVRNYLIASALFWYDYFHVDGLRVDAVASMLYLDYSRKEGEWVPNCFGGRENLEAIQFFKQLNSVVYHYYPDTMTVAEESTAFPGVSQPVYNGGLGFGLKWNMGWMHDFLNFMSKDPVHRKYHHNDLTFSMLYAFTENFILPLSHDEVVHGKASLLSKMPGDVWQRFANLRAAYGFMTAHPGKKLLFMGSEFGQWDEWNHEKSLDWHLNHDRMHSGLQRWVRDLNHYYRREKALFEEDFEPAGFEWVDCNDWENSIVSFIRWSRDYRHSLVAIFNFTPVVRYGYRLGLPFGGTWSEVLNSDAGIYGGSNTGNLGRLYSESTGWMNRPYSVALTLPPLSALYLQKTPD